MLMDLLRVSRVGDSQDNGPGCFPMSKASPRSPRHKPFIVAEVFVRKLLEKGPFHHLLGSVVLQEVDEHVLQAGVVLRGGGLFGQQVEPRVLLVERLPTEHTDSHVRSSSVGRPRQPVRSLTLSCNDGIPTGDTQPLLLGYIPVASGSPPTPRTGNKKHPQQDKPQARSLRFSKAPGCRPAFQQAGRIAASDSPGKTLASAEVVEID